MRNINGQSPAAGNQQAATPRAAPAAVSGEGFAINPGLWTVTSYNSKGGNKNVNQRCITSATFQPLEMFHPIGDCNPEFDGITDHGAQYKLNCSHNGYDYDAVVDWAIQGDQGQGRNLDSDGGILTQFRVQRTGNC